MERMENLETDQHPLPQENIVKSQRHFGRALGRALLYWLPVLMVCIFPVAFLYGQNAGEAAIQETFEPLMVFISIGTGVYALCALIFRSVRKGALGAALLMLVFLNFRYANAAARMVFPELRYWHVCALGLFVMGHIIYFLGKLKADTQKNILRIITVVFGGLVLVNLVLAIPQMTQRMQGQADTSAPVQEQVAAGEDNPNIYWLIFDEYSSFEVIDQVYQYDYRPFDTWLQDRGFSVVHGGSNEGYNTDRILTNYINMDYLVTEEMSYQEKAEVRESPNGLLKSLLAQNGYQVKPLGNAAYFFGWDDTGNEGEAVTVSGENLSYLLYHNTALQPFVQLDSNESKQKIINTMDWFNDANNYGVKNRFVCPYLELPHQPFYFDENGNSVALADSNNWKDKQIYLGQYNYTTKRMMQAVEAIQVNDPEAVIILQSDHSARAASDEELFKKLIPEPLMRTYFAAVYLPDEKLELDGLSGVNVLRQTFSRVFNVDLPAVEVPDVEVTKDGK